MPVCSQLPSQPASYDGGYGMYEYRYTGTGTSMIHARTNCTRTRAGARGASMGARSRALARPLCALLGPKADL